MARASATQEFEALPEADCLEGFPHPRETRVLYGHQSAERVFADAFGGGRMHHAWLLAGREGIGKATLAYRVARYVLARPDEHGGDSNPLDVPEQSSAARQVRALSHPGLLVLRRPYDSKSKRFGSIIPVDEVRRLKSFIGLTAGEETWRAVIVDTADELNINAANALLKTLEEPPGRVLFLLVSSEPSGLLPTIRSRCRRLDLQPLSPEALRMAAEAALANAEVDAPSANEWDELARLSGGSVRRTLQLVASGGLDLQKRVAVILKGLPKLDWVAAHNLADSVAGAAQEQRFEVLFNLLLEGIAQTARGRGDRAMPYWAEVWQAVLRDKAEAEELNLDRKALILRTFERLAAVSSRPVQ